MRHSATFHAYAATLRAAELALDLARIEHIGNGLALLADDATFPYQSTIADCILLARCHYRATLRKLAELDRELRERAEYERAITTPARRRMPRGAVPARNYSGWWRNYAIPGRVNR